MNGYRCCGRRLNRLVRHRPSQITPADAARLLAKVNKRAPTAANNLLRFMRRVFRFGVRRHLLVSNPVADFDQQDAGGPERKRRRALSRGELEDLFKALRESPGFGGENFLAIKLLLALGVRKGELLKATWDEFDFEGRPDTGPVWRLPGNRTKTGEPLTIPLVPEVIDGFKRCVLSQAVAFTFSQNAGAIRAIDRYTSE